MIQYNDPGCRGESGSLCEGLEGEILSQQGGVAGDLSYKKYMVIGKLDDHVQIQKYMMIIFHENCKKQK